tara:strand:- start:501 stop:1379 length:879 start_codon:yes stop_codon:yes gene_type:complete
MQITLRLRKKISKLKNKIFFKEFKNPIKRNNSYPFISGDTFLAISDYFIIKGADSPSIITHHDKKQIIFIENDLLAEDWVREYAKKFKIVILHNGDKVPKLKYLEELTNRKIYVFGTNINFVSEYIEPIPIGIENAHHKKNGDLDYYNPVKIANCKKKKNNIIFASFAVNTKVRKDYEIILDKYKIDNTNNLSLDEYRKRLNDSYFIISPPGNGIDCHRTWEALYHKTIPVIEKKYYLFSHINLPILTVNKLEEFLNYSKEKKLNIYKNLTSKYNQKIYMQWWVNHINSKSI